MKKDSIFAGYEPKTYFAQDVRDVVALVGDDEEFTMRHVAYVLKKNNKWPRGKKFAEVTHILNQLKRAGVLELVRQGGSSTPSIFKLKTRKNK